MKKHKLKPKVKSFLEAVALITIMVAFMAAGLAGMKYSARNFDKRLAEQKMTEMSVTQISQK